MGSRIKVLVTLIIDYKAASGVIGKLRAYLFHTRSRWSLERAESAKKVVCPDLLRGRIRANISVVQFMRQNQSVMFKFLIRSNSLVL